MRVRVGGERWRWSMDVGPVGVGGGVGAWRSGLMKLEVEGGGGARKVPLVSFAA